MQDEIKKPKFIVFEGGEGTGKSTQAKLLYEFLLSKNIPTILTREPGGSKQSEEIRELLVRGGVKKWDGISETLLHYASRNEHIKNIILPELKKGRWVICDRFFLSTDAYQGAGYGVNHDLLEMLKKEVCKNLIPDITFILDLKIDISLERIKGRTENNRYENFNIHFHKKIKKFFKNIEPKNPTYIKINAEDSIKNISKKIISHINKIFIKSK